MGGYRQFIGASDMRDHQKTMRAICSVFLLGSLKATWSSAQQTDATASGAIRALEREWVDAQSKNDNRALDLILDNSVVYVEYGQLVSKADYLLRIKHQDPSTDEIAFEPITVRFFGNTAVVTGSYGETQRKGGTRTFTHLALRRYLGI